MHPDWRRICDDFLTATSYSPDEMDAYWKDRHYDRENRPATYLTYPDAEVRVPLGTPSFPQTPDVWTVLRERRSKRNFLDVPLTLDQLNCLLWGSQGIVRDMGDYQLRTAPSAGALYPIETYLVVNRVEGLEPGLYHLDVRGWALEGIRMGDLADAACAALLLLAFGQRLTPRSLPLVAWNVFGLIDILFVVSRAVKNLNQDPSTMEPLTVLPLGLLPLWLVPLIISTHLLMLRRAFAPASREVRA